MHARHSAGPGRLLGLLVIGGLALVGELLPVAVVLVLVILDAVAVDGGRRLGACATGRA
ncbi:hypothetical protein [Streptomyces sp. NPDC057199]|uniref:hypothetical protein n=1 Tax=Streptomyces sp. NPDC057199 TaxID=3346047 RepID=UPI003628AE50